MNGRHFRMLLAGWLAYFQRTAGEGKPIDIRAFLLIDLIVSLLLLPLLLLVIWLMN
ncbi:MAG: hypothetical protein REI09_13030 [Candidatus Dactylopiibacterium sp.]|nr:hypothetical protein [Candidatus Dactylopiibacterium sp.]